MTATPENLKRLLLRHVPGLASAEVATVRPFQFEARITALPGHSFETVKLGAEALLDEFASAVVGFRIVEGLPRDLEAKGPAWLRNAAHYSDQHPRRLKEALVDAVPALGRMIFTVLRDGPTNQLRFEVGHEDGTCSEKLVEDVRAALGAIGYAGMPFEVLPINPKTTVNHLYNAGFFLPRRDPQIVRATEEDEDTYAARIRALVSDNPERFSAVDDFEGTAVYATPTLRSAVPLHAILALYDRVYVEMMPKDKDPKTYFERNFRISAADFREFSRSGRVWPIFKFNLGNYPDEVVRPWLEQPGLPFISPRQLDYVTMRHAWVSSPILSFLRQDREAARVLLRVSQELEQRRKKGAEAVTRQVVGWLSAAAESFEGIAFHRGHIAAGNLSPGAIAVYATGANAPRFKTKAIAQTIEMDAFGAAKDIMIAQAFNASLNEGMLFNWPVLNVVLPYFRQAPQVNTPPSTESIVQLVESLELSYDETVPASEYAAIFDLAETRRIRAITAELLRGLGTSVLREELRERVGALNQEIAKLRKHALEARDVDVVGDLAKGTGAAFGSHALFKVLSKVLGLGLAKKAGAVAFDKLVEDTALGSKLDRVRGAINRISPAAIRIYRVTSKLDEARRRE
jgi:hypothetical protein